MTTSTILTTILTTYVDNNVDNNLCNSLGNNVDNNLDIHFKGWLAIAKLKPLSLFISLLLMLKKALDNGKMVK